jgi:hypothetical protein
VTLAAVIARVFAATMLFDHSVLETQAAVRGASVGAIASRGAFAEVLHQPDDLRTWD